MAYHPDEAVLFFPACVREQDLMWFTAFRMSLDNVPWSLGSSSSGSEARLHNDKTMELQVVNRWLSIRLDMLGTMVSLGTALAVTVVMPQSAGLAGLALTAALNLTGILNWSVRQSTDLEIQMNRCGPTRFQYQPNHRTVASSVWLQEHEVPALVNTHWYLAHERFTTFCCLL